MSLAKTQIGRGGVTLMWTPDGYKEAKAITLNTETSSGAVTIEKNNSYILNDRITISVKGKITLSKDFSAYGEVVLIGKCSVDGSTLTMSHRILDDFSFGYALARISGTGDYASQRFCLYGDNGGLGFTLSSAKTSGQTLDFVIDRSFTRA